MPYPKTAIHFCSPEEFYQFRPSNYDAYHETLDTLLSVLNSTDKPLYPWDASSIQHKREINTGQILTCSAGGITDGKTAINFHFLPEEDNLTDIASADNKSRIKQRFASILKPLDIQLLQGIIIGGDIATANYSSGSMLLFKELKSFLYNLGIKHISYFWGQNLEEDPRGVEAYYSFTEKCWRILKYRHNSHAAVDTLEELVVTFKEISLSPHHILYLKDYPNGLTHTDFLLYSKLLPL